MLHSSALARRCAVCVSEYARHLNLAPPIVRGGKGSTWGAAASGTSGRQLRGSPRNHRTIQASLTPGRVHSTTSTAFNAPTAASEFYLVHGAEPEGRFNPSHRKSSDDSSFESIMFCMLTAISLTSGTHGCLCPWAVLHGMSSENEHSCLKTYECCLARKLDCRAFTQFRSVEKASRPLRKAPALAYACWAAPMRRPRRRCRATRVP